MKNKKGFSLIELLAVLVIIGLLLLIVIPAVSRLITSNDDKDYNNYLTIIEAGATSYADYQVDNLGGSNDTGCVEVTLEELIEEEYIKEFNHSDITCSGKARLNNNKGNLDVSINLTCVNDKGEETFKKEEITDGTCVAFTPRDDDGLKNKLISNGVGSSGNFSRPTSTSDTYIKGSNPNNYVWYSGKMWRIVSYNDDYVKLISTDIITSIPRNNSANLAYANSTVDKWLTNVFLPTLKDHDKFLVNANWDVSPTGLPSSAPNGSNVIQRKVALLNSYDTSKMGTYLDTEYQWLTSNYKQGSSSTIRIATRGGSGSLSDRAYNYRSYYAIRPAITMKVDTYVLSGNGTASNPYILEGNSTNIAPNTPLNIRVSGEYLYINNVKYRIINVYNGLTKVIMVDKLPSISYDSNTSRYSTSSLYNYLNNSWYNNSLGTDKNLVEVNGSWCDNVIDYFEEYNSGCSIDYTTGKVGLPTVGDIFSANTGGSIGSFWTINPYANDNSTPLMNIVTTSSVSTASITSSVSVRPVMYLKSNVAISSGEGTEDSPFRLKLN